MTDMPMVEPPDDAGAAEAAAVAAYLTAQSETLLAEMATISAASPPDSDAARVSTTIAAALTGMFTELDDLDAEDAIVTAYEAEVLADLDPDR